MATTSRKKDKKSEVIPQEIKQEPIIEAPKEYLDEHDLRSLEVFSRDVENARLLMAVEEQSLKNMILEFKLMDLKIEKQKSFLTQKAKEFENTKAKFKQFKNELWPKYGLIETEGLGYDVNSGKIVKP